MNKCYSGHSNCLLLPEHYRVLGDQTILDWRRILYFLGVDCDKVSLNEQDCVNRRITDSREIAYRGYVLWQREVSKKASFCKLFPALKKAGRKDLVDHFKKETDDSHLNPIFMQSTAKLFGREKELNELVEFCTSSSSKLLVLSGLPGVGKSVLLRNGIKIAHEKTLNICFIMPMFLMNCAETNLDDVAAAILEEINPGKNILQYRVAFLRNKLINITCQTVLVLEVDQLNIKPEGELQFWSFIREVLSVNKSLLKIIITTTDIPDLSQINHIKCVEIYLKGLDMANAAELLREISPNLLLSQYDKIFQICGGNPFMLTKLAAHVKVLSNHELNAFFNKEINYSLKHAMKRTDFKRDMSLIFDKLELDEKIALAKICCFSERIKIDSALRLFGEEVKSTLTHLSTTHCLLERSECGRYYRLSQITRTFIEEYSRNNPILSTALFQAKTDYIIDKLNLLLEYDKLFFCPSQLTNVNSRIVQSYQNRCITCTSMSRCCCILPCILQGSFQRKKCLIIRSIKLGLGHNKTVFAKAVQVCFQTLHFLKNYLASEELCTLYDMVYTKVSERGSELQLAAANASKVLIKVYHNVPYETIKSISRLTDSINCLEKHRHALPLNYLEFLSDYYLSRAYLRGNYNNQFKAALKDIKKGRIILKNLTRTSKVTIELLSSYGYEAAIYNRHGMFRKSLQQRKFQVEGYRKNLGIHPYTAKILQYHAECFLKLQEYNNAALCCLVSYQMYLKIEGIALTTMKVLSIYGKVLINKGAVQNGIKKLQLAIQNLEDLFGEHDCVASCYEQLADAEEKINPNNNNILALRLKASEIRKQFNEKIIGMDTYNSVEKFSSSNSKTSVLSKPKYFTFCKTFFLFFIGFITGVFFCKLFCEPH
ncbi:uncharacterized protein LOC105843251 isoform X1 [Hydra vulgaris]|uniref:Uncharacterized protein LOC105843251 isoform X1 n=1 Tax=Hydra vulgaris TaxID=6087 RepID=A0ABM4D6H5_HYDVU